VTEGDEAAFRLAAEPSLQRVYRILAAVEGNR